MGYVNQYETIYVSTFDIAQNFADHPTNLSDFLEEFAFSIPEMDADLPAEVAFKIKPDDLDACIEFLKLVQTKQGDT